MDITSPWPDSFVQHGEWWETGNPERKTAGAFMFSATDGLELRLNGPLVDIGPNSGSFTINGFTGGDYWTLADCFTTRISGTGSNIHVGYALRGLGMDVAELDQLDTIRVGFEGLWSVVQSQPRGPLRYGTPSIDVSTNVTDGLAIGLESKQVPLEVGRDGGYGFDDQVTFIARTDQPSNLRDLSTGVKTPLQELVAFALQRPTSVSTCAVSGPGTVDQSGRRHEVAVYWEQVRNGSRWPKSRAEPALQIPVIESDFETFIRRWFDAHRKLSTPIGLRLMDLVAGVPFAEPRFLLAAQALEAMHRRLRPDGTNEVGRAAREATLATVSSEHSTALQSLLTHAHEPTFRMRVKELVGIASPEVAEVVGDRLSEAIALIVKHRNGLTHWAADMEHPGGLELQALRMVSDAVFDLALVKEFGLSEDQTRRVVKAHQAKQVHYWLQRALTDGGKS